MKKNQLIKELEAEGANHLDALAMAEIAAELDSLGSRPDKTRHFGWTWPLGAGVAAALFAGTLVMASGGAVPGEALFPVKQVVEAGQMRLAPGTRPQIMMERSLEVNQLVAHHRPAGLVLSTLSSYNHAASRVSTKGTYPAWEYCSQQLRQAQAASTGQVKAAIGQSLARFHLNQT